MNTHKKARKQQLAEFFGKWPGMPEEAEKITKTLERGRKRFRTRE